MFNFSLTALHLAVRHKHLKCVKLLLANGADVNKMDNFGFRPIHDACLHGNADALILLLKHGATTDGIEKKGLHHITPVLYAAKQGHLNCLRLLSSKQPLDNAVLWDASSKRGSWEILEYLSSKGIYPLLILRRKARVVCCLNTTYSFVSIHTQMSFNT